MSIAHIVATKICPNCEKEFFIYDKYRQQKFCSKKCMNNGINSAKWKGGKYIDGQGYVHVKNRNHPYADHQGYILEHRLVMEKKLGRFLLITEEIHHLDYNKQNNNPNNLELHNSSSHRTKHNLENNPFKGRKHSLETKQKMSEIAKKNGNGKWNLGKPRPTEVIKKILETKKLKKMQNQYL